MSVAMEFPDEIMFVTRNETVCCLHVYILVAPFFQAEARGSVVGRGALLQAER
jgi:hypothetical protein